jgi:hypothetical protein
MKKQLTDTQVEIEIEKLQKSPLVKLAMTEERLKRKRRKLADAGITLEELKRIDKEMSI